MTDRQVVVLELVAEGCSNKEIAHRLDISEQAVKEHVSNLLRLLAAPNRAALGDAAATRRFVGTAAIDPDWLRFLFQEAPMHVAVLAGPDPLFVAVNDAYQAASGGRELIGRRYRDVFPGREDSLALLLRVYATGERSVGVDLPRRFTRAGSGAEEDGYVTAVVEPLPGADGTTTGVAVFSLDVTDDVRARRKLRELEAEHLAILDRIPSGMIGSDRGTVSVLKDVTDIRHTTEELARSAQRIQTADEEIRAERDRLDLVLRSVPNPIIVVDNDNQIISTNAAAQRLFDVSAGWTHHALANDAKFTSFLAGLRLDPTRDRRAEIVLSDPATEERLEMEVTVTEVRDQHGAVVAIVSAMQEVGRLRELERRRLQEVLFESEKLAATGRLAASIAHEINNPLEAVQNSLYLLATAMPPEKAERRYLEIAQRETQRMSRILRQMLGFYKPVSDMAPVDINALIDEAETLVDERLRKARIVLARDLEPSLPLVRASADRMKQVLLNLLLNAVEAMPGGGRLTVTTRYGRESERDIPLDAVRIEVKDTGVGMDDETQARIFEAFFSTKSERGTGLGLWVSHGIIQGHGGTIRVGSRPGQGTTFVITLPVAGPPDADG